MVASKNVVTTLIDMLSAGVVNSDVQLLIDPTDGKSLMIDLTESSIISTTTSGTVYTNDLNAIRNFISEVFTNLPSEEHSNLANEAIRQIEQKLLLSATTHTDPSQGKHQVQQEVNRRVLDEAKT